VNKISGFGMTAVAKCVSTESEAKADCVKSDAH
jgi:hypothetical protein